MANITLFSLMVSSFFSFSPFHTIENNNNRKLTILENSHFSRFYSSVVFSNTNFHSTIINNNVFSLTLSTPLVFVDNEETKTIFQCVPNAKCCMSDKYAYTKGENIANINVTADDFNVEGWDSKRPFFQLTDCGNLTITKCNFLGCYTNEDYGGGILVEAYLTVILHNSIFDSCNSNIHGAGGAIGKKHGFNVDNDPVFEYAQKLDIQYTCFSNCYQRTDKQGFGSALIMAANDIIFFYASTVNCPSQNQAYGAQFDIDASNSITSQYVNATGGNSKYCGAMEYRKSKAGFFQFQTLTMMKCKYVTSFTSVTIDNIDITSCNVNNNTISAVPGEDANNFPSLIFVREKNLNVHNFYFFNNVFNDNGKLTEKNRNSVTHLTITLEGCYADFEDVKWDDSFVSVTGCTFKFPIQKTFPLRQLHLGHCQGDIPPGPMIISSFFTASSPFSVSDDFTKSNDFSNSKKFTSSGDFTKSSDFTESNKFSHSNLFSKSDDFTSLTVFSDSKIFSKSNFFSQSRPFTESKEFEPTNNFIPSGKFTNSVEFSNSHHFTSSEIFFVPRDQNVGKGGKTNKTMIIGIVAAVVAGIIIAALIAFFISRKRRHINTSSAGLFEESLNSVTVDNTLNSVMNEDDPFVNDFIHE